MFPDQSIVGCSFGSACASVERLPKDTCSSVAVAPGGGVWVGTARGLLRFGARPLAKASTLLLLNLCLSFAHAAGQSGVAPSWKVLLGGRWLPGSLNECVAFVVVESSSHLSCSAHDLYRGQRIQSSFAPRVLVSASFHSFRIVAVAALAFDSSTTLGPHRRSLLEAVVVATDQGLAVVTYEARLDAPLLFVCDARALEMDVARQGRLSRGWPLTLLLSLVSHSTAGQGSAATRSIRLRDGLQFEAVCQHFDGAIDAQTRAFG